MLQRRRGVPPLGQPRVHPADARHRRLRHARPSMPWADALLADPRDPRRRALPRALRRPRGPRVSQPLLRRARRRSRPTARSSGWPPSVRPRPDRLAVLFRSVRPEAAREALAALPRAPACPAQRLGEAEVERLYAQLRDRALLAQRPRLPGAACIRSSCGSRPTSQQHPDATRATMLAASAAERQESYAWLFKTRHKSAQDKRIRILLEEEAFERIHAAWRRLGYPVRPPRAVLRHARSAARPTGPEALAELIGIVLNDGVRQPTVRIERLHFAAGTPYETVLELQPAPRARTCWRRRSRRRCARALLGRGRERHRAPAAGRLREQRGRAARDRRQDRHRRPPAQVLRSRRPPDRQQGREPHGDGGVLHRRSSSSATSRSSRPGRSPPTSTSRARSRRSCSRRWPLPCSRSSTGTAPAPPATCRARR